MQDMDDLISTSLMTERVSEHDRDECINFLNGQHAVGRLSVDELDRRQGLALVATTRYDLLTLTADLPTGTGGRQPLRKTGPPGVQEVPWTIVGKKVVVGAAAALPVLLGAWLADDVWHYNSEAGFYGGVLGGAIGYATCAARSRIEGIRRRRR